jgi:hypothetical protein
MQSVHVFIRHLSENMSPELQKGDFIRLQDFVVQSEGGKPYLVNKKESKVTLTLI